ncbi:MAG: CIA30 family protein [Paracoccaceae bacterium]
MVVRYLRRLVVALVLIAPAPSIAEDAMIQLSLSDQSRWAYFSDQVMGGESEGQASFGQADGQPVLRLTGAISTANRGGFCARSRM